MMHPDVFNASTVVMVGQWQESKLLAFILDQRGSSKEIGNTPVSKVQAENPHCAQISLSIPLARPNIPTNDQR